MDNDPTSGSATMTGSPSAPAGPAGPTFFGHPRGLSTLFFTEMWERFSFYGMRALLILFMTAPESAGGLGFSVLKAGAIYGLYTGYVYTMTLPGGWIADNIIGQRRAVLYGGIIIALGHFSMAVESIATFYLGLVLIIMGTGLLKPNVSTMVGELYRDESGARRDAAFSIFYMGINIGAFVAPLVTGFLGEGIDWHLGFAAAGVGMVLGLVQYVLGGKYLGDAGLYPDNREPAVLSRNKRNLLVGTVIVAGIIAYLVFVQGITMNSLAEVSAYIISALALGFIAYVILFGGLNHGEKKKVAVIGIFFLAAAVFWSGFEQAGSSFNLVAEQLTDTSIFAFEFPASLLQSVNPLFIIAFAPVFAWLWVYLSNRHLEPSTPLKFAGGLVLLGAGFAVMIGAAALAATGVQISPMWLIVTYFLHTSGELALSPVGLSAVTKLSPHRYVGQMMGIWFLATSVGNVFAGLIAGQIGSGVAETAGVVSPEQAMDAFQLVAIIAVGGGIILALFSKPVRRWMGSVR